MKDQRVADGGAGVFQPDFLLPLQFFTGTRGKGCGEGERRLMLAILEDAVDCFQKYLGTRESRGRLLCSDAEEWFMSDDRSWLFSFVNVCEVLGLQPDFIREGLQDWKTRQLEKALSPKPPVADGPTQARGRKRGTLVAA
ncbi:MAG: hypothetical protein FJ147_00355 [Deltaproteobacteria bacterium]|nr:hypothetical protein [Deltaproteobacteria bacterium]